ncbi:DUF2474 domain-containing protein [Cellvibrio sp.]|uniref:DUF2474 domain-containing protein n=1 Tax=Cellvibrio sp. TaxID=1965322 RepID=UPI003964838B
MLNRKIGIQTDDNPKHAWWVRVGWLLFIWAASVLALAVIALLIKIIMHAAGMSV